MSISLSTITNYTGADGILLNAQQTGLEAVGFGHRLKSLFGIGDARKKNQDTLDVLKEAILTNPDLNTDDLKAEVERLFKKEHTFLAVDMSRIRGIMSKMTTLADGSDASLDRRVDLHLAAIGLPPRLTDYADDIVLIAKQYVKAVAHAPGNGGVVNVAKLIGDVIICGIVALTSPSRDRLPPDVRVPKDFTQAVGRHLQDFLLREDRTLRTDIEVEDAVCKAFDFYWRARTVTKNEMACPPQATLAEQDAAKLRMKPHERAALEFACTVGAQVTAETFDQIHDNLKKYPPLLSFDKFDRDTPLPKLRETISDSMKIYALHPARRAKGVPIFDNLKANRALARYVSMLLELRLTYAESDLISSRLHFPSAAKAFEEGIYQGILTGDYDYSDPLYDKDV